MSIAAGFITRPTERTDIDALLTRLKQTAYEMQQLVIKCLLLHVRDNQSNTTRKPGIK